MTITPSTLFRAAGVAAIAAGMIFIGVQINHPHSDVTSVTTTEWVVRNSLKVLMAALALAGITGMYLRQVRQIGVLGLIGYLVFGAGYLLVSSSALISGYVLPSLADSDPGYVNDVLAAATNGTVQGDIGLLHTVLKVQGFAWLAGGLVFAIALFRARVLARWAAVLLGVGSVVTVLLAVMPDAFYRFLAFPNAIAMIALGYSLWRTARTDTATLPTPVDDQRVATTAGAEWPSTPSRTPDRRRSAGRVPGRVELDRPIGAGDSQPHPGDLRITPAGRDRRRPAADAHQPAHRRLTRTCGGACAGRGHLRLARRVPVLGPVAPPTPELAPQGRPDTGRGRSGRRRLRALDDAVLRRRTGRDPAVGHPAPGQLRDGCLHRSGLRGNSPPRHPRPSCLDDPGLRPRPRRRHPGVHRRHR